MGEKKNPVRAIKKNLGISFTGKIPLLGSEDNAWQILCESDWVCLVGDCGGKVRIRSYENK